MVDEELSAALRAYSEAWFQFRYDPARRRGDAVLSAKERFLAAVGSDRGPEYWAVIRALQAEADRVPDPGGPITNYIDALHAWAATHPEIDPNEMGAITSPLIRDHR
jgi:hypothetical protein